MYFTDNTYSFIFIFSFLVLILYSLDITLLSNTLGWSLEQSIASFYCIFIAFYFLVPLPSFLSISSPGGGNNGDENKSSFNRLLKLVLFPGPTVSFSEVLLADALTSISKLLKDFGTTLVAIYATLMNENILDFHDNAMILVAVLASLPFWIRVRQCWIQLDSAPDLIGKIPICLNIIKYFSAFPPIWLTAAASIGYSNPRMPDYLFYCALVNTCISFGVCWLFFFYCFFLSNFYLLFFFHSLSY
jgi:hypothetical protein